MIVIAYAGPLFAAAPSPAPPVPHATPVTGKKGQKKPSKKAGASREAKIRRLVSRLSSEVWAERESAERELHAIGRAALPFLKKARQEADAETAIRLDKLIIEFKRLPGKKLRERVGDLLNGFDRLPPRGRQLRVSRLATRLGEEGLSLLMDLLETEEEDAVRLTILRQMEWLGVGPALLPRLLRLQQNIEKGKEEASSEVRAAMLRVLAKIPSRETRAAARRALKNGDYPVRVAAIDALARLDDRSAIPQLRKLAAAETEDEELRAAALRALIGMLDDKAPAVCRSILKSRNLGSKLLAATLGGIVAQRDASALPLLLKRLHRQGLTDMLRAEILQSLATLAAAVVAEHGEEGEEGETTAKQVKQVVAKTTEMVRGYLKASSSSFQLRRTALNAAVLLGAKELGADIEKLLRDGKLRSLTPAAVTALVGLNRREAAACLKRMIAEGRLRNRISPLQIAEALYELRDPEGKKLLLRYAKEGSYVEGALQRLGEWHIKEGLPLLKKYSAAGLPAATEALFAYNPFDDEAFFALLRRRLTAYFTGDFYYTTLTAQTLDSRGIPEEALRFLDAEADRTKRRNVVFESMKADLLKKTGRYAEAAEAFNRMRQIGGADALYLNNRAWFHCTAFRRPWYDPRRAVGMVRRATALDPRSSYYADTLGWALHGLGDYKEAARQLRRALELIRKGDLGHRAWERTRLARPLFAGGAKETALAEIKQALADAPDNAEVRFEAAEFFAYAGMRDQAVDALLKAVDLGWVDVKRLLLNPEFDSLRKDPAFDYAVIRIRKAHRRLTRKINAVVEEVRRKILGTGSGAAVPAPTPKVPRVMMGNDS